LLQSLCIFTIKETTLRSKITDRKHTYTVQINVQLTFEISITSHIQCITVKISQKYISVQHKHSPMTR